MQPVERVQLKLESQGAQRHFLGGSLRLPTCVGVIVLSSSGVRPWRPLVLTSEGIAVWQPWKCTSRAPSGPQLVHPKIDVCYLYTKAVLPSHLSAPGTLRQARSWETWRPGWASSEHRTQPQTFLPFLSPSWGQTCITVSCLPQPVPASLLSSLVGFSHNLPKSCLGVCLLEDPER